MKGDRGFWPDKSKHQYWNCNLHYRMKNETTSKIRKGETSLLIEAKAYPNLPSLQIANPHCWGKYLYHLYTWSLHNQYLKTMAGHFGLPWMWRARGKVSSSKAHTHCTCLCSWLFPGPSQGTPFASPGLAFCLQGFFAILNFQSLEGTRQGGKETWQ